MVGDYLTGWHTAVLKGPTGTNKIIYPIDPDGPGTPYAGTDFMSQTKAQSVFAVGDKDAVIRSIFVLRDFASTSPTLLIMPHGVLATGVRYFACLSGTQDVAFGDCNIHVPGGFQVLINGLPYAQIYYEINAKG